jgi:hypothetical protein
MPQLKLGLHEMRGPGPHPEYDASLLFWRMDTLHVDREHFAIDDPLLFRELQGRCTLCLSKKQCIRDLASDLRGTSMDYCPNAGTLNLLEALARCSGV